MCVFVYVLVVALCFLGILCACFCARVCICLALDGHGTDGQLTAEGLVGGFRVVVVMSPLPHCLASLFIFIIFIIIWRQVGQSTNGVDASQPVRHFQFIAFHFQ